MADGYDLHLDEERTKRLAEAAHAVGQSPDDFLLAAIDDAIDLATGSDDDHWVEDLERLARMKRDGTGAPLTEAFARLRADLAQHLADRD